MEGLRTLNKVAIVLDMSVGVSYETGMVADVRGRCARCLRCGGGAGIATNWNKSSRRRHSLKIQVHCVALGFSANVQLFRLMRKFLQDCRKKRIVAGLEAEKEKDSDGESIYESRKLLIRQMQGQIAKQVRFIFTTDQKYN